MQGKLHVKGTSMATAEESRHWWEENVGTRSPPSEIPTANFVVDETSYHKICLRKRTRQATFASVSNSFQGCREG
jgi:hypothetical protein